MIVKIKNFDLGTIANSGQLFRMNEIDDDFYELVAFNKYLTIKKLSKDEFEFSCSESEFKKIFYDYFDLSTNYDKYKKIVKSRDVFLKKCIEFSKGLRILKQEKYETLISFIISQRKSIGAIKTSVERISKLCGEKKIFKNHTYYKIQTPIELYNKRDKLSLCGLGYRHDYVINATKMILDGVLDLYKLDKLNNDDLKNELLKIKGVGEKVASCVMLFAYQRYDICPIDVWIKRVLDNKYNGVIPKEYKKYQGIIQQYWFYYANSHKVF